MLAAFYGVTGMISRFRSWLSASPSAVGPRSRATAALALSAGALATLWSLLGWPPFAARSPLALLWALAVALLAGVALRQGRAARRDLFDSENRLRVLLARSAEVLVVVDRRGLVTFTSPAADRLLGRPVLGLQSLDFIHPEDRTRFTTLLAALAESTEASLAELCQVRAANAHGSWCCTEVTGASALAEPGVGGIILSFHDPSQQRAVERAFRESEQRYAAVVEAIAEGVIAIDASGRVVLCNASAAAIFGSTVDLVLSCKIESAPPLLFDMAGRPLGLDDFPALATLRTGQPICQFLCRFQRPGHDARVFSVSTQPIVRPGEPLPYMVVCSISDITDTRAASEALRLHASRLEFLRQIDRAILSALQPEALAHTVLDQIRSSVRCERAAVALIHPDQRELQILAISADAPDDAQLGRRVSLGSCPFESIFTYGMISVIDDLQASYDGDPALAHLHAAGFRSCMAVTLFANNELIGLVHLSSPRASAFTQAQGALVVELANHLAVGLQNARLFSQVSAANQRLRSLSRQLMGAQESERRRIARELHDEIGQALALIKLNIRALQRMELPETVSLRLEQSLGIIEETLLRVRQMALDLRPAMLDDLGLASALRWYVDQQARLAELEARFDLPEAPPRLPTEIETACFRMVQEALANTVRHASASQVSIRLEQSDDELLLSISDDGVGFDPAPVLASMRQGGSGGLLSMHERLLLCDGRLSIESSPGHGTTLSAWVPLQAGVTAPDAPTEGRHGTDSHPAGR
ncbi:PAS domain S-box protein [Chloroflexia bacterium SDU3-3]|nr:PAS domain S-box protein [Chloroflexia bacterium SDU3-3]